MSGLPLAIRSANHFGVRTFTLISTGTFCPVSTPHHQKVSLGPQFFLSVLPNEAVKT